MTGTFYSDGLGWQGLGYFASLTPPDDPELRRDPESGLWLRLERIIGQAKAGNFSEIPKLFDLYAEARCAVLRYVCNCVLADAGTRACFQRMIQELEIEKGEDRNKVLHYCNALSDWGSLSSVIVLLEQYKVLRVSRETAIIPLDLSFMIEEGKWGPISDEPDVENLPDYCRMVMERYEELKSQFKTDQVLIFNATLSGVIPFAKLILSRLSDSPFDLASQRRLRRRFEASTGINCSAFYKKKRFQPLVAAAILEDFLQSPEASKYEDGARYFFGHRIPN